MRTLIRRLARDEAAATAIEYALILGLISVAAIAALTNFNESFLDLMAFVQGNVTTAMNSVSP